MPVSNHQEIPEIEMRPEIRGRFLASTEHGARAVCLLINTVAPGAVAPLHKHTVAVCGGADRLHVSPKRSTYTVWRNALIEGLVNPQGKIDRGLDSGQEGL
jgi:hypothetical protein